MPRADKKDKLLATARELFAKDGYHAVGIDTIIEKAGISKKTLYHHFKSKEDLIAAVLDEYDRDFREYFTAQVEAAAKTPQQRLLAVFDVAEQWFRTDKYYGCMFISAANEYSAASSAIRKTCRRFKDLMRDYIEELAKKAGYKKSADVAMQLALLLEGAIVTSHISNRPEAAQDAKKAARLILAGCR